MTPSEIFTFYIFGGAVIYCPLLIMYHYKKYGFITVGDLMAMLIVSFLPFLREFVIFVYYGKNLLSYKILEKKND